jgi:hypothetical protein
LKAEFAVDENNVDSPFTKGSFEVYMNSPKTYKRKFRIKNINICGGLQ